MTDFNSLDQIHQRALVAHTKLYRVAIERLISNLILDIDKKQLLHQLIIETRESINSLEDEEVDEIVESIEADLTKAINENPE